MAKAQRVLSIEIGYSLTQVCEMDFRSKHPQVYGVFSMKTPDGILNDGAISPTESYIQELKSYIAANGMQRRLSLQFLPQRSRVERQPFLW